MASAVPDVTRRALPSCCTVCALRALPVGRGRRPTSGRGTMAPCSRRRGRTDRGPGPAQRSESRRTRRRDAAPGRRACARTCGLWSTSCTHRRVRRREHAGDPRAHADGCAARRNEIEPTDPKITRLRPSDRPASARPPGVDGLRHRRTQQPGMPDWTGRLVSEPAAHGVHDGASIETTPTLPRRDDGERPAVRIRRRLRHRARDQPE